uniref:Uncharacterized protein n=1 Tax=Moniliophthora roreri TaxID=221103 RepID=A0A0W0EUZ7_MONRR
MAKVTLKSTNAHMATNSVTPPPLGPPLL